MFALISVLPGWSTINGQMLHVRWREERKICGTSSMIKAVLQNTLKLVNTSKTIHVFYIVSSVFSMGKL